MIPVPAAPGQPASAPSGPGDPVARQSAEEFEAVFLSTLLAPVFESLAEDADFAGGAAEATWTGLLTDEYARAIARAGGVGLADAVYRELLAMQENEA